MQLNCFHSYSHHCITRFPFSSFFFCGAAENFVVVGLRFTCYDYRPKKQKQKQILFTAFRKHTSRALSFLILRTQYRWAGYLDWHSTSPCRLSLLSNSGSMPEALLQHPSRVCLIWQALWAVVLPCRRLFPTVESLTITNIKNGFYRTSTEVERSWAVLSAVFCFSVGCVHSTWILNLFRDKALVDADETKIKGYYTFMPHC